MIKALTNDQLPQQLHAFPLVPTLAIAEVRSVLQQLPPPVVFGLVLDVLRLIPASRLEARDEAAAPEREVVAVDGIASATAGELECAEVVVGIDAGGDLLDGL